VKDIIDENKSTRKVARELNKGQNLITNIENKKSGKE